MHDTSAEPGVGELLLDQVEELIVTIVEEVRERPAVAVAIAAAVLGAIVGSLVAARSKRRPAAARGVARRARGVADTGELIGLGVKLLQNPIVRGYLVAMLRRRFVKM